MATITKRPGGYQVRLRIKGYPEQSASFVKRIEAVLKPDAAAALADLRQRRGTYSAIIEEALVAASKR